MKHAFLNELGLKEVNNGTVIGTKSFKSSALLPSFSPVDGECIACVTETNNVQYQKAVEAAQLAYSEWSLWPAPKRGELIRQYGDVLRLHKEYLGKLVSYEMGKSLQEGYGEVQEMIDICDFAVGLSRQLYGLTMHSERPSHRMYEQWHPLGIVGVISAFNFPVAVWSWNAMIALVCGNVVIWKGSEKTPLCAIACQHLLAKVIKKNNAPEGISSVVTGDATLGNTMALDSRIALLSATGSTRMGKAVATTVASRLGRYLLELGGNNAVIVSPQADLKLVVAGTVFGAVGTCGQRCTTTRRLIVHATLYDKVKAMLQKAYKQIKIGNPLDGKNHMGPLIDRAAVDIYLAAIHTAKKQGAQVFVSGGEYAVSRHAKGHYVKPCIIEASNELPIVQQETFAPILYLIKYDGDINEAIKIQNNVPQGLSSALMTTNLREAELFLSAQGSDCGIANINIGTSGAEIGGAFGGEKETGGGRESGSDSWKAYMRRQTNTINYSTTLPLAQGIKFDL
jgi:aldehyde dehydrogenase (NAD+)